ncbi:copper amine oxidase N-terminal domain-containing protein [Petroclostridium xylanilyticum]|uniref:copper amine oxidase N-terminal domain-containing protein n=1 Tax=Petroclostridium xylanilyticum TaxID=1792311 RepID=UPI000B993579|nr:copper amine oxidase N-terminal domain-containing protein [Petroclostridium xylanilyticum]
MLKSKKKLLAVITAFIITLSLISVVHAAGNIKKLDAWYADIKIISNNQQINMDVQPFVVNGTTYVPLRTLANIFNKDVHWDSNSYTITITDKPDPTVDNLKQQLQAKDYQIYLLEQKVKMLEGRQTSSYRLDIDDLEDELNDDYSEYEDIKFNISLSGDEDDITVRIYIDMSKYGDEWRRLTTGDKKEFLQDICDVIKDEYPDADIDGYIKSSSGSSTLLSFSTSSNGTVRLGYNTDLSDLEEELDDKYYDYFDDVELSIELDGNEDDITFYININYNKYKSKWNSLTNSQIQTLMSKIYNDIKNEFSNKYIEGYVYDTYNQQKLAKYYRSSSGYTYFTRY